MILGSDFWGVSPIAHEQLSPPQKNLSFLFLGLPLPEMGLQPQQAQPPSRGTCGQGLRQMKGEKQQKSLDWFDIPSLLEVGGGG